ncbi:conserved hypothetical protein [Vibrio crassostreae]|uniref:hypothetical protein n=1 Tax=Vibrio crassostreae TaxID=246167 RepID=UPI001B307669|nr:hypothetical protein [Vibrio crassostreae]CAK1942023.1 conserved hypothetical protein [Vibrio crassostreae]CAK1948093.1 conserved hypothetical protein [Vibrio crassostreae]CAK2014261.1 conserved hypothetical protein [Vibrio crassostreae]CAK2329226.1 conserved hypothetical protein [Vibrio crassostreae]CAK2329727.1 conserved hypothetical protein [Vibrio crassostreae]
MIKNWTITTEAVKNGTDGIMARERYLLAKKHLNHRNTEAIISLFGNANTSQRIALVGEQFRVKQHLNRKGGRPLSSYAMEYVLTLPKGHRPTSEQWKSMISDCCLAITKLLELKPEELKPFKSQVRAVLHQQKQSGVTGTGDHVHLIFGKVLNGKVLKVLQQKKCTAFLKQAFNTAVLKHTGLDHKQYKPYELNRGKRLETWKYQQTAANESLHVEKVIMRMQKQADKWFEAENNNEQQQMDRQLNRLIKTFDELSELKISSNYDASIEKLKNRIMPSLKSPL